MVSSAAQRDPRRVFRQLLSSYEVVSDRLLAWFIGGEFLHYLYIASKGNEVSDGDSGGPVYTIPDSTGNTKIIGVFNGKISSSRNSIFFHSWEDVAKEFDLRPIQQ